MKYITINENQRGLLFRHGKFEGLLEPGRHLLSGGKVLELVFLFVVVICHFDMFF